MSLGNPVGLWQPEDYRHKRPSNVYVVGLVFARQRERGEYIPRSDPVFGYPHSFGATRVLLQVKARPGWQVGYLNGPGGKVEAGEWPADAMYREFEEETGLALEGWKLFAIIHCSTPHDPYGIVYFYHNWADIDDLKRAVEQSLDKEGDEPLALVTVRDTQADDRAIIMNIRWLIQLARNHMIGGEHARYFEIFERYDIDPPVTGQEQLFDPGAAPRPGPSVFEQAIRANDRLIEESCMLPPEAFEKGGE